MTQFALTLTFHRIKKRKRKKNATIELYVPSDQLNMCHTTIMQHFHFVTMFDLPLALTLTKYKTHTYTPPFSFHGKPFGRL